MKNSQSEMYLSLLKKVLTTYLWEDRISYAKVDLPRGFFKKLMFKAIDKYLRSRVLQISHKVTFDRHNRENGLDWPLCGETMIGLKRLDNLQFCIEEILNNAIPGDLIETGVWRGGATIFMRAVLMMYNCTERNVWVADSFKGVPPPQPDKYPHDKDAYWHKYSILSVAVEQVKKNFERYGLLDDKVKFLEGWFKDTLPDAPIEKLSLMRLDGDLYESTVDAFSNLYPKLSSGGYVIIDDYYLDECKAAVNDMRDTFKISDEMISIDESSIYWKKTQ